MDPIPDLDNLEKMAAWGRRSALMKSWNQAKEAIRDAATRCQSADVDNDEFADQAIEAAERIKEVAGLWKHVK